MTAALLGVLGLLYLAARETPLFALRELDVAGAPPEVRRAVEAAAGPFLGESLVALDPGEVRERLEALPTVRSLRVDRAFPHTLRIAVVPERPLARLRQDGRAWILSAHGRVMAEVPPGSGERLPTVQTSAPVPVRVGVVVDAEAVAAGLATLRRLPDRFPTRIRSVAAEGGTVTLVLQGGTELRLGEDESVALKLEVAGRVLGALAEPERSELAYLDVAVPERPVGGTNSQVSTSG